MKQGDFAYLNEEGKKELGHIFPDSIPVFCMISENAILEGTEQVVQVYRIDLARLTEEQRKMCFDYVAQKRQGNRIQVEHELTKLGFIPLQSKWVSGAGTDMPFKYMPDFDDEQEREMEEVGMSDDPEDLPPEEWMGDEPNE